MNNMLRARLLRDLPSRKWVVEIPGIMLALNAMVHEPHGFSASMIATGREPSLPPDLESEACASPSTEDPVAYVEMVRQRLALTHQQMTPPPAPEASNPYHEGDLIFVMTTPPERTSKLAPWWKGPFVIKRVPNAYQVTYEDDMVWRTVHINHAKRAKVPAGGFPVPMSPPAPSSSSVPDQVTQPGLQDSDPISAMRPAVYYPRESVGNPTANENSPFQIDPSAGEFSGLRPGLYKPADPASQHHTWTSSFKANSLDTGFPSPTRTSKASSSGSRTRTGIIYPLQPRQRRPDVCIDVEASLPEPAALHRPELQPTREAPTGLSRTHKRLSRKRRRNRSTAIYRPAKRSPPRGRWRDL